DEDSGDDGRSGGSVVMVWRAVGDDGSGGQNLAGKWVTVPETLRREKYVFLGLYQKNEVVTDKNTKDAETNLKDELIDLLGTNVETRYYNKKLLIDKYCDKMLKRKKSPKITNCEVLTKKGPITLKIYREDGSEDGLNGEKLYKLVLTKVKKYGKPYMIW
nr:hypothetical protein [Tanacetum cinerariifolium]